MPKGDHLDNNEPPDPPSDHGAGRQRLRRVTIRQRLQERAGRDLARSVIYDVLERIEKRGLVESRLGDPTPERGGYAKRSFKLKGNALSLVQETLDRVRRLSVELRPALGVR